MDAQTIINYALLMLGSEFNAMAVFKIFIIVVFTYFSKNSVNMPNPFKKKYRYSYSCSYLHSSSVSRIQTHEFKSLMWYFCKYMNDNNIPYASKMMSCCDEMIEKVIDSCVDKCNVTITSCVVNHESKECTKVDYTRFTIMICASSKRHIDDLINVSKYQYKKYIDNQTDLYVHLVQKLSSKSTGSEWTTLNFKTCKSFDNLFFSGKDMLLKSIDNLLHNPKLYEKNGMARTLGMLLHGPPGTGKTSIIKAIANYTRRNLVTLATPAKNLHEMYALVKLFPSEKSIIVLEEVDCGIWGKTFHKRTANEVEDTYEELSDYDSDDKDSTDKKNISVNRMKRKRSRKITLGEMLEFLDGIVEMDKRIIIMTTNHVDVLDPALIRPGRIDINLKMGYLDKFNINQYYIQWFGQPINPEVYFKMRDDKYTQADLGKLFQTKDLELINRELSC